MAFQLYVQPRGGENIAAGIMQAGQAIGQGFRDRRERKEQRKADEELRRGFQTLVSADPELQQSLGIQSEEDWDAFSPNDIKGMYEGLKMRAAAGQQQLQQMQMDDFQRRHAASLSMDRFMQDAGQLQSNPDAPYSNEFRDRVAPILATPQGQFAASYAAETGTAPDPAFMDRVGTWMKEAEPAWQPSVVDLDGNKAMMTSPRSAVPLRDPQEVYPGEGPQMSPDGQFYFDGRSWRPMGGDVGMSAMDRVILQPKFERRQAVQQEIASLSSQLPTASTNRLARGPSKQHIEKRLGELNQELTALNQVIGDQPGRNYTAPQQAPAGAPAGNAAAPVEFATEAEAQAAAAAGQLQRGQVVIINGQQMVLE